MSYTHPKGRGAQKNVSSRFLENKHEIMDDFLNFCEVEGEDADSNKTKYIEVFPKTFVNKVNSPDLGMGYSANPYQGCEHGCVYCYARNSHEYWGYGAGLDFERNILFKSNAPQLLEEKITSKNWDGNTIVFSGNTDCYQPLERKLEITRKCFEVMLKWKHPTGIITKNSLILRYLDIRSEEHTSELQSRPHLVCRLLLERFGYHQDLHSFPTRRSSDLEKITSKNWDGNTIVFSCNTDCDQPLERKLEITRKCFEVMLKWKHPTGFITKNSLILRHLDILKEMAKLNIISVNISITSLSEDTRRLLEPRTASIKQRLKTVEVLSQNNIPVRVMMAPIIPSLNSHEILPLVKKVAELGAKDVNYTIARLNGQVAEIFKDWAHKTIPDRAERILNQIAECHGGNLNDSDWGRRIKGNGTIAQQVKDTMVLAKNRYLPEQKMPVLDASHFLQLKDPQLRMF